MEIRILGPLEVAAAGREVDLPAGKVRLLLAALVVHANHVVSTDRLFEFLWRGHPPETAANTLQTHVSHLRRSLEPAGTAPLRSRTLIRRDPGYLLAVDPERIDAVRFERLVAQARPVLGSEPAAASALLRTALALWRGEPLADFTFEPFAQAEITRLTELRLAALEDRIGADLALGGHAAVCGELAPLVQEHPLREGLWAQLMVALYRCGRQADALRAYARLRATLAQQLGIDPSPHLGQLEEAILRQRPELDWPPIPGGRASGASPAPVVVGDPPAVRSGPELLTSARLALQRCRWQEAFDLYSAADEHRALGGADLDALAEVAFWLGRPHESHLARQRAHAALVAEGEPRRAAMAAVTLSLNFGTRRRPSVAGGWYQRAERLLAREPECAEHGFLAWAATMFALAAGDHDGALRSARRTYDLGRRFDVAELQALGLALQGYVLVRTGRVDDGLRLMDEGMTWAVDGRLAPTCSAVVFCRTIDTCYALGDYRRASEWMEAIADCFARTGVDAFPGDCEAHSIGVLVGRGAWAEGELRARRACAAMEPMDLSHTGLALAEIGEIRLRRGDLVAAEQAFSRAVELGSPPIPGQALLRLARGDVRGAAAAIAGALADQQWDHLARRRLLPAQVEIALADGDVDTARSAAAELTEIATRYARPAVVASAECAQAAVLLAEGEPAAAVGSLRRAIGLWEEAGAPYEAARARLLLGNALERLGDRRRATVEVDVATAVLRSLGARLDIAGAPGVLQDNR